MFVVCTFVLGTDHVVVRGRTDYPACGDFRIIVRAGETFCGLSFEELTKLDEFETDPETGKVVNTKPRSPLSPNATPSGMPFPDWLRKKPAS